MNPKAYMKDPMTFDDYDSSRWISWPFHLLDCCLVTDAGGAYVVTTPERASDLRKKPVWVLGAAEGHNHGIVSTMPDYTRTWAEYTGPKALERASVTHQDIDLAMIYDSFTYTVLVTLESLGFCGPGEAPDFVKGQRTAPGGDFAMNTSGGGLSYTHSGMYGMFLVIEKVYHCGGGIVYHRHDEKGLNWEPGGIRSGAGVRSSGVSQESTGSSDTWEAALCRLCLRR